MSWLLILGCLVTPPGDSPAETGDADSGLGSWNWEGLAPAWTAEELGLEVELGLTPGMPHVEGITDHILDLLSRGDSSCPGSATQISEPEVDLEGCDSETGYTYRGILVYEEEQEEEEGRTQYRQFTSTADFEIIHPTGEIFLGGGSIELVRSQDDGAEHSRESRALILGMWEDPLSPLAWLSVGISAYLTVDLERRNADESTRIGLSGTLGMNGHNLYFDELVIDSSDCALGPREGSLWVRQSDSSWNQLNFGEECGCAQATWNEELSLGEVCLSLEGLGQDLAESLGAGFL